MLGGRADSDELRSLQAHVPALVRCAHGPLGHGSACFDSHALSYPLNLQTALFGLAFAAMTTNDAMQRYYQRDRERARLEFGLGLLEFERTTEILLRTLPPAPAVVADIGGGPGRYTDWLVDLGYTVIHRDVVPDHVAQVNDKYLDSGPTTTVNTAVGDACELDLADASVDALFLLGPLYHLPDPDDRNRAVSEAARVTRSGGRVYAAAIGRWSARIQGLLVDRLYREVPAGLDTIDEIDKTGFIAPVVDGGFTGYAHTPDDFRNDMTADNLELETLVAVEGIASAFTNEDVAARLADPTDRTVLLDSLRMLEAVPELLGASSHLLAVARRR